MYFNHKNWIYSVCLLNNCNIEVSCALFVKYRYICMIWFCAEYLLLGINARFLCSEVLLRRFLPFLTSFSGVGAFQKKEQFTGMDIMLKINNF